MSTKYTIGAESVEFDIVNTYSDDEVAEVDLGMDNLDYAKGEKWNTGIGQIETNVALVDDENGYKTKHIAQIKMYKSNCAILLAPGDEAVITVPTENVEAQYYYATIVANDPLLGYEDGGEGPVIETTDDDDNSNGDPD